MLETSDECSLSEEDNHILPKIPIPKEIIDEYSSFFGGSRDLNNFNFIYDLNLLGSSSVWTKKQTMEESSIKFEKPVGMKTLDHYFSKKSSSNKIIENIKKSKKLSKSPEKQFAKGDKNAVTLSESIGIKNIVKKKSLSPKNKMNIEENNEVSSQDLFHNQGNESSKSSDEFSKQNITFGDDIEREIIPCTQGDELLKAKFNNSNYLSSGTTQNDVNSSSSDDSDSEGNKQNKIVGLNKAGSKMSKNSPVLKSNEGSERKRKRDLSNSSLSSKKNKECLSESNSKSVSPSKIQTNKNLKTVNNDSSSSSSSDDERICKQPHAGLLYLTKNIRIIESNNKEVNKKQNETSSSSESEQEITSDRNPNLNQLNKNSSNKPGESGNNSSSTKSSDSDNKIKSKTIGKNHVDNTKESVIKESKKIGKECKNFNYMSKTDLSKQHKDCTDSSNDSDSAVKHRNLNLNMKADSFKKSVKKSEAKNSHLSDSKDEIVSNPVMNKKALSPMKKTKSSDSSSSDSEDDMVPNPVISKKTPSPMKKLKSSDSSSSDSEDDKVPNPVISKKAPSPMKKSKSSDSSSSDSEEDNLPNPVISKKAPSPMKKSKSSDSTSSDSEDDKVPNLVTNKKVHSPRKKSKSSGSSSSDPEKDMAPNPTMKAASTEKTSNASKIKTVLSNSENDKKLSLSKDKINHSNSNKKSDTNSNDSSSDSSDDDTSEKTKNMSDKLNKKAEVKKKNNDLKKMSNDSESSNDEKNEFNFKNSNAIKMLGLNTKSTNRNIISCASAMDSGKSVDNKNLNKNGINEMNVDNAKNVLKGNDQSCTEDSQSDSSSSEDEEPVKNKQKMNNVNISEVPLSQDGKDKSIIFTPVASSSFVASTPDFALKKDNLLKMAVIASSKRNIPNIIEQKGSNALSDLGDLKDRGKTNSSKNEKDILKSGQKRRHSVSESDDEPDDRKKDVKKKGKQMDVEEDSLSGDKTPHKKMKSDDKLTFKLDYIKKNMVMVKATDKLSVPASACIEDINSDDEIYTLQCPKELSIDSLLGKKVCLSSESVFKGKTKSGESLSFETFAVSVPSRINLLLPSKQSSSFKLGDYKVSGSIIVSERYEVPEVDTSNFSSTCMESSDDETSSKKSVTSTPLPAGLKLRHPLHGLNYKNAPTPDFKAVISREKKKAKKKKKEKQGGENSIEQMIDSLMAKKKLSLSNKIESEGGFKKPAPPSASKNIDEELQTECGSQRGIVVGKNMISLVSDDESRSISDKSKKNKKKNKEDLMEKLLEQEKRLQMNEEEHLLEKKKKKKKKEKQLEELSQVGATEPLSTEEDHHSKKKKKDKKDKILHLEQEVANMLMVAVSEDLGNDLQTKKKKKKDKNKMISVQKEEVAKELMVAMAEHTGNDLHTKKKKKKKDKHNIISDKEEVFPTEENVQSEKKKKKKHKEKPY